MSSMQEDREAAGRPASATGGGSGGASESLAEAREAIKQGASQGAAQVKAMAQEARDNAAALAGQQKGVAAQQLKDMAGAIRKAADDLDEREQSMIAGYVRDAAATVDDFAGDLDGRSIGELVSGLEQFARRQPAAFLGGAVMAGFMLARFAKSSAKSSSRRGEAEPWPERRQRQTPQDVAPADRTQVPNPELYTHYGAGRPDAAPTPSAGYQPAAGNAETGR